MKEQMHQNCFGGSDGASGGTLFENIIVLSFPSFIICMSIRRTFLLFPIVWVTSGSASQKVRWRWQVTGNARGFRPPVPSFIVPQKYSGEYHWRTIHADLMKTRCIAGIVS
jgi:hypothetical protein